MNIIKSFDFACRQMAVKQWEYIYIAVDIHGTIFKPTYSSEETYTYYPYAKEVLRRFSECPFMKIILWSASHPDTLKKYKEKLEDDGIKIAYVNENPEVFNTTLASFDKKFYFNVGLDDKFGFDPDNDWFDLNRMMDVMPTRNYMITFANSIREAYTPSIIP